MHGNDAGVVLKNWYPYRNYVTILSRVHGKIEARCFSDKDFRLSPGVVVSYELVAGVRYSIKSPRIELVPVCKNLETLEWIHYLLHVCTCLVPELDPDPDIFDFLWQVLKFSDGLPVSKMFCCASLIRLLSLCGMCDRELCVPFLDFFHQVTSFVVDHANVEKVDSERSNECKLVSLVPSIRRHVAEILAFHPGLKERRIVGFDQ